MRWVPRINPHPKCKQEGELWRTDVQRVPVCPGASVMFPSMAHTLPGPALSSCPSPRLLCPPEGLISRRDPAFFWDAEPWLPQAIAGSVTGLKLVSPKPARPLDYATSWAEVESIFTSCWFATWSLALSNGVQDLPCHFCYSPKEPILFSFSSNFYKYLSWK